MSLPFARCSDHLSCCVFEQLPTTFSIVIMSSVHWNRLDPSRTLVLSAGHWGLGRLIRNMWLGVLSLHAAVWSRCVLYWVVCMEDALKDPPPGCTCVTLGQWVQSIGPCRATFDRKVLDLATPEGCNAELTYVTWKPTGRELNPRHVNCKSEPAYLWATTQHWYCMYCVVAR